MSVDQVLLSVSIGTGVSFFVYIVMKAKIARLLSSINDISFEKDKLFLDKGDIEKKYKLICEERVINHKYKKLYNTAKDQLSQVNLKYEDIKKKYVKLRDDYKRIHVQVSKYKEGSGIKELEKEIDYWKGKCLDSESVKRENEEKKIQIDSLVKENYKLKSSLSSMDYDMSIAAREIIDLECKISDLEVEYNNAVVKVPSEGSKPEITYYNENPSSNFYPLSNDITRKTLSGSISQKMSSVSCEIFKQSLIKNGFSEKYYKKAADFGFWRVGKSLFIVRANQFADSVGSKGFITKSIQRTFGKEINWRRYRKNSAGEVRVNDMYICDFNTLVKNYVTY